MNPLTDNHALGTRLVVATMLLCGAALRLPAQTAEAVGVFEGHTDIGTVLHPGSARYDEKAYTVRGSGENMWFGADAFHFVWKRIDSEDVDISATAVFPEAGGNAHRKAVLMIRQSLDAGSVYADVALHGDGLTSLQFREEKGGNTREVQANVSAPHRLRLEKRGDALFIWTGLESGDMQFAGGTPRIGFAAPFYVGIGVCSHDKDAVETAVFSGVEIDAPKPGDRALFSALEVVPISSTDRRAIYTTPGRIETPGWTADGESLTFLLGDTHERIPAGGGTPQPAAAGKRRAPDRSGNYYHTDRSGSMQIWRDGTDASEPEQITADELNNCFPRLSPDGRSIAFLSFEKGPGGCPADGEATLRVLSLPAGPVKTIARFTGGRSSLGPAAWSPDGKRLTYASYHQVR